MKLNPIAYAIVAAGLVAPAFAAYSGHTVAPKSTCGMPTGKSHVQSIIDGNTYNSGVDSNICWHNRVRVSGSVEVGYRNVEGDVAGAGASSTSKALDLHQAILGVDAKLNSAWSAKVVARYGFNLASALIDRSLLHVPTLPLTWDIPEAYLTYSNPSKSPLFFKVGKGWLPFGHYADPYEILPTVLQVGMHPLLALLLMLVQI